MMRAHRCSVLDVGRSALSVGHFPSASADDLHLVPEPLLVPMRPHAFAALVLGNFCFSSFFKRAHSDFQSRKVRFNHLIRRLATRFLWLLCNYNHALPQERYSARSNEANDAETSFVQQLRESLARPELDVSAVPEGIEMCVPLVGERKNKILRVAVIRRADDNVTAGPEQLLRETRQATRSSEMLNYLGSNSHIEALIANRSWIVVHSELMKYQPGRRTLCEPNAVRARLATHHFVSSAGKLAA